MWLLVEQVNMKRKQTSEQQTNTRDISRTSIRMTGCAAGLYTVCCLLYVCAVNMTWAARTKNNGIGLVRK